MAESINNSVDLATLKIRPEKIEMMSGVPLRRQEDDVVAPVYTGVERRRVARSPMAETQRAMPFVDLPNPDCIPSTTLIAQQVQPEVLARCAATLERPDTDFWRAMKPLAVAMPESIDTSNVDIAFMITTGQHATVETHDYFFRIRRLSHDHPAGFLHGIFRSLQTLKQDLEETPTSLDDARIQQLGGALKATLAAAMGAPTAPASFGWARSTQPLHKDYPARRWLRGHQIFACLSQCLIFAFNAMEHAVESQDADAMRDFAGLAGQLLRASAASLELTGDFPEDAYQQIIRVSMEGPYQPDAFSGLLSNDHRQLVVRMKAMRPAIDTLREQAPDSHRDIVDSLASVYASHKFVCSRFVGADQPSLLMARENCRPAAEQIDRFKTMRMRLFEPAAAGSQR